MVRQRSPNDCLTSSDLHVSAATAIEVLACPGCWAHLEPDAGQLRCVGCDRGFIAHGGVWDFAPEIAPQPGVAQRFMEHSAVARIYEDWFRPALTRAVSGPSYADEERYLDAWLGTPDGPVLDLACGTGRYTRWMARRLGAARVLGLDLSSPMLRRARAASRAEGQGELLYVRGSALSLPIASGLLAAVSSFGALHLFPSAEQALGEVGRVLRPGGAFTCLTTGLTAGLAARAAERAFSRIATVRFFERSELERCLRAAGLEPLDFTARGALLLFAARRR